MIAIPMKVATTTVQLVAKVDAKFEVINHETYKGDCEFTPSSETQIVQTKDKVLLENIVINPIPQNYGLITYNGSVITIT